MTRLVTATADMDKIVGARIRAERLAIGMSQMKLAENLGITFQQVQKYEKGTNRVAVGTLIMIARIFGVSPISLFRSAVIEIDEKCAA